MFELNVLSQNNFSLVNEESYLVGKQIKNIVPKDWIFPEKRIVIQISLQGCSSCQVTLEQLLKRKEIYNAEFYVMSVKFDGILADEKKISDEKVNVLNFSQDFLDKLNISQYPTFIYVNTQGTIEYITPLAGNLDSFLLKPVKM